MRACPHPGWFAAPLLLMAGGTLPAAVVPQPFEAEYRIVSKRMGIEIGRTERRFAAEDEHRRYRYRSSSRAVGLADLATRDRRTEESLIEYAAGRLRTLRYRYHRDGRKKQWLREAEFDWDNDRLILTVDAVRRELELSGKTSDRLGSELLMMQNLRQGRPEGVYRITNGSTVHDYRIEVLQRDVTVQTPLGEMAGIQLRRRRTTGTSGRETLLWCIPELGYLPVRIEGNVDAFVAELIYYRDAERELRAAPAAAAPTPLLPPPGR